MGRKKIPVYSIVATDSRNARDGRYIEDLGRYYPLEQPAEVTLKDERVLYWLDKGAKPSNTVRSLLSKRGLMMTHAMRQRGASEEEIAEAVDAHIEHLEEKGEEIKMTAQMRRQKALEAEEQRARELEEEARKKAEAERKAKEEAERKAKEEAEAAEAEAAESDAADEADEASDAAEDDAASDTAAAGADDADAADEADDTDDETKDA